MRVEELKGIQTRHEDSVINIPGMVGIAIALTEDSKDLAFINLCGETYALSQSPGA
ncbi:MAG: hypothetical protein ACFFCW_33795 [Candidatus Hodarchaeota archaeon]